MVRALKECPKLPVARPFLGWRSIAQVVTPEMDAEFKYARVFTSTKGVRPLSWPPFSRSTISPLQLQPTSSNRAAT
jgi:hypothetical protein